MIQSGVNPVIRTRPMMGYKGPADHWGLEQVNESGKGGSILC